MPQENAMQNQPSSLPQEAAEHLQKSLDKICALMANIPDAAIIYLKLCINRNPLITREVFDTEIGRLREVANNAADQKDKVLDLISEIETIRRFFLKDESLHTTFQKQIERMEGDSLKSKQTLFCEELRKATDLSVKAMIKKLSV
jgi:hypothetical protein